MSATDYEPADEDEPRNWIRVIATSASIGLMVGLGGYIVSVVAGDSNVVIAILIGVLTAAVYVGDELWDARSTRRSRSHAE